MTDNVFREEVRAFLEESLTPDISRAGELMTSVFADFDATMKWHRILHAKGWIAPDWPEEYGGGGKPQVFQDIVTQEMARQRVPFMTNTIGLNWAGPLILERGTEEAKQKYIRGILNADDIWCQGFSEPDHGSDLGSAQVKAVRDGDEYVINGSKIWTSLGSYAKYMILLARTDTGGPNKYAGLSFFLAPMHVEGITPQPIKKLTSEFGFCQTFFHDARIPANCMMGQEGEGWQVAMATLMFERGNVGGQAGGISMMDLNVNDVLELARRSTRNGRPVLEDPLIRDQMVQFLIEAKSNSLMGAKGRIPALNAERPGAVAMSGKLRSTELKRRFCQFALSLQGANGGRFIAPAAVDGGKWQRIYFNSFSATIGGGTTQVQYNIMGERVLGLPKS